MTKDRIKQLANHHKQPAQSHNARIEITSADITQLSIQLNEIQQRVKQLFPEGLSMANRLLAPQPKEENRQRIGRGPVSRAFFNQNCFIKQIIATYYPPPPPGMITYLWHLGAPPSAESHYQNKNGLCAALLFIWYLRLNSKDKKVTPLLDMLSLGIPSRYFIEHLNKIQQACGNIYQIKLPLDIIKKYNLEIASYSSFDNKSDNMDHMMGCLDSIEANSIAFDPAGAPQRQQLKDYFQNLEQQDRECVGLHAIMFVREQDGQFNAHIFGWTALEKGYLLFDANNGEYFFDDYQDLQQYIDDYFSDINDHYWITVNNFYSQEDLDALVQHKSSLLRA